MPVSLCRRSQQRDSEDYHIEQYQVICRMGNRRERRVVVSSQERKYETGEEYRDNAVPVVLKGVEHGKECGRNQDAEPLL